MRGYLRLVQESTRRRLNELRKRSRAQLTRCMLRPRRPLKSSSPGVRYCMIPDFREADSSCTCSKTKDNRSRPGYKGSSAAVSGKTRHFVRIPTLFTVVSSLTVATDESQVICHVTTPRNTPFPWYPRTLTGRCASTSESLSSLNGRLLYTTHARIGLEFIGYVFPLPRCHRK